MRQRVTQKEKRPLWRDLYWSVSLLDFLRGEAPSEYRQKLVPSLKKSLDRARAWERAHLDYHVDADQFDVATARRLLVRATLGAALRAARVKIGGDRF